MNDKFLKFLISLGLGEANNLDQIMQAFEKDETVSIKALRDAGFTDLADSIENPVTDGEGNPVATDVRKEIEKLMKGAKIAKKEAEAGKTRQLILDNGREITVVTPLGMKDTSKVVSYQKQILKITGIAVGGIQDTTTSLGGERGFKCTLDCIDAENNEFEMVVSSNYFTKAKELFAGFAYGSVTRKTTDGREVSVEFPTLAGKELFFAAKVQMNNAGDYYTTDDADMVDAVRDAFGEEFVSTSEAVDGTITEKVTLAFATQQVKFHSPQVSSAGAFMDLLVQRNPKLRDKRDSLFLDNSSNRTAAMLATEDVKKIAAELRAEEPNLTFVESLKVASEILGNLK